VIATYTHYTPIRKTRQGSFVPVLRNYCNITFYAYIDVTRVRRNWLRAVLCVLLRAGGGLFTTIYCRAARRKWDAPPHTVGLLLKVSFCKMRVIQPSPPFPLTSNLKTSIHFSISALDFPFYTCYNTSCQTSCPKHAETLTPTALISIPHQNGAVTHLCT
jgi:hypothetical protein